MEDRKVWQAFSDGDFSCQKSEIPGTAIGRDHCGEQENKKNQEQRRDKGDNNEPEQQDKTLPSCSCIRVNYKPDV